MDLESHPAASANPDSLKSQHALVKVAKWGNSLAVRLPRALVEELALKDGDEVHLRLAGDRRLDVSVDRRREEAFARMKDLSRPLPPGYKFDRDEIYDRLGPDAAGRKPYDD